MHILKDWFGRQEPHIFRLLQALRDRAHRFAITGHRKNRAMSISRLEDVPELVQQSVRR